MAFDARMAKFDRRSLSHTVTWLHSLTSMGGGEGGIWPLAMGYLWWDFPSSPQNWVRGNPARTPFLWFKNVFETFFVWERVEVANSRVYLFNYLKGQCHEIFDPRFFFVPLGPLIHGLNGFAYRFEFAKIFDDENRLRAMPHSAELWLPPMRHSTESNPRWAA
jgi:hypothetical protein